MRILHLSDFHFVSEKTLEHANKFVEELKHLNIDFPLSVSKKHDREKLIDHLKKHENGTCDSIVFSGDASTLGDLESMREAAEYLGEIQEICLKRTGEGNAKSQDKKNCIAIIGNHDQLAAGASELLQLMDAKSGFMGKMVLKFINHGDIDKFKKALTNFMEKLEWPERDRKNMTFRKHMRTQFSNAFENYTWFPDNDELGHISIQGACNNGDKLVLNICPLNTVATQPIFANMAVVTDRHLGKIRDSRTALERVTDGPEVVNIAVSHHGLMALSSETVMETEHSNPNFIAFLEHAITSQLNGFKLGHALQAAGFDAHLHGHEHQSSIIRYDFDVDNCGSIYSCGAAAAFGDVNSGISFSVIEIPNPYCMQIEKFYDDKTAGFKKDVSNVVFDQVKSARSTELAKKEILDFYYSNDDPGVNPNVSITKFAEANDKLLLNSGRELFVFGVSLRNLRNKLLKISRSHEGDLERERLKDRFSNSGLKILVVKPIGEASGYKVDYKKDIITELTVLKRTWEDFFVEFAENLNIPIEKMRENSEVRFTNTPLSHAGTCEYQSSGKDTVILPKFSKALIQTIKIVEAHDTEVFLELDYRLNLGLLQHFAGSAWNLFDAARKMDTKLSPDENPDEGVGEVRGFSTTLVFGNG